jgi:ABC-type sugar transport system ATPase subunit
MNNNLAQNWFVKRFSRLEKMSFLKETTMEQVRQLSTEKDQLKNTINDKEKENYELQSKTCSAYIKLNRFYISPSTSKSDFEPFFNFRTP